MKKRIAALLVASLLSGWYFIGCVSASTAFPSLPTLASAQGSTQLSPGLQATSTSPDVTISAGMGWADQIPHQVVRTGDDTLYYFGGKGDSSTILQAYWTQAAGLPASAGDFSGSLQVDYGADIISTDAVYDGSHIIHVLTNDQSGKIIDRPFDTSTNKYKTAEVLDTGGGTVAGAYVGTSGITGLMDQNSVMHLAYWSSGNHIIYRSYTYNLAQDVLTLQTSRFQPQH